MEAFSQLGRRIEDAWRIHGFALPDFPKIAAEALAGAGLPATASPDAILRWALGADAPPRQADPGATFGQPPITVFAAEKFRIDALFWVDGSPAIHQHRFSGAFQVLAGSSIHSRFSFTEERRFSDALLVGKIAHLSSDLLKTGDVLPIESGPTFIHSTFHLDRPSVSVVVRTPVDRAAPPQYEYWKPSIAIDSFFDGPSAPWTRRLVQIATLIRTVSHPEHEAMVGDLLARADALTAFRVLEECLALPDRSLFARLLERARPHLGDLVDTMASVFENARRASLIRARRTQVHAPDLRFLLAVLLNATTPSQIQSLVRARRSTTPGAHPADTITEWIGELAKTTIQLSVGGQPWEPNALGIPECDETCLAALRGALRLERGDESGGAPTPKAAAFLDGLRRSTIFGPMFP